MYSNEALDIIMGVFYANEFRSEQFTINIMNAIADTRSEKGILFLKEVYNISPKTCNISTAYFQNVARLGEVNYMPIEEYERDL